jgi:hypothetical protein
MMIIKVSTATFLPFKLSTVKMPTVKMPTVKMPTVKMPTVKMPTVKMPTVKMSVSKLSTLLFKLPPYTLVGFDPTAPVSSVAGGDGKTRPRRSGN